MSVEIKLKPRQLHPGGKQQASKNSISGTTGGKKNRVTNGPLAMIRQQQKLEDANQTRRNQRIMVLLPTGKHRFMLLSEYETR